MKIFQSLTETSGRNHGTWWVSLILVLYLVTSCTTSQTTTDKKTPSTEEVTSSDQISSASSTRLIEKVTKTGDEIVIPYEKHELANGLTLVIHEDHSDPVVHVDVTYHVGSAREELSKSGFAHFFEHMMFQGSENVADEEHFKVITEAGGTLNGSTSRDRTNYYETVPSNQLELMLWLEADRMGFFLDAVTQEKFEIQRATVKNEKGQNYDNSPYRPRLELNAAALYPYGHPYSWLTIGKLEDLDRVDVDDLKKFFLRWYGPNNATLTIGGDVNSLEVIEMAEKYFGTIPRGPEVEDLSIEVPTIQNDRFVSYIDRNIRFPALQMTFPTVPRFHPDEAPLDCLAAILGQGRSSYFYKKFVLTQKAIQASASHPASELAGEFTFLVLPFPGQSLSEFEVTLREVLDEFAAEGVSDDDIIKFVAGQESNIINGLASVSGKVSQLADFETLTGSPNGIKRDLERYTSVTKADVMRVFDKYIKGKSSILLSVVPEGTPPARPDNYAIPLSGDNPFPQTDYSGLSYSRPQGDSFNRSQKPQPGVSPLVPVPEFWKSSTSNGIKMIGTTSNEIPTVSIQLTINGGHRMDAFAPKKSGLASLTASMMNEATENYSAEEFQEELQRLGSSINVNSNRSRTTMSINTLKKNLAATLKLAEERLFRPKFQQEDFERLKLQQLEDLKSSYENPSAIADLVYDRLLWGDEHIYSVPTAGIEETVSNITLDDVLDFYGKYYAPNLSELVVVGDVSESQIKAQLSFLNSWEQKNVKLPELPDAKSGANTSVYLVDKEQAPQSEIRMGYVTDLEYDVTGDYYKTYLMNFTLGGAFNSRINLNLREDKGWTYGAGSYLDGGDEAASYTAYAGVLGSATDSAVYEFMNEIKMFREDGITTGELSFLRKSIGQRDARNYETPGQKANFLRRINHYDLDRSFVKDQMNLIESISKDELNSLARKYLQDENFYILVVGDAASHRANLEKLGYPLIMLNSKGDVIENNKIDSER